ncbi:MAG: hypothetical protein AB7I06_14480 [Burkholderiales bacterium]
MNNPPTTPIDPQIAIGFRVEVERCCLVVQIGGVTTTGQLTPQMALELARDLIVAGLAHAEARAAQRVNADAIANGAIGKASSH